VLYDPVPAEECCEVLSELTGLVVLLPILSVKMDHNVCFNPGVAIDPDIHPGRSRDPKQVRPATDENRVFVHVTSK